MKEEELVQAATAAVARLGVDQQIVAAGMFQPRGHTGSAFVGGLAGADLGSDLGGSLAGTAGLLAGEHGAQHAHDAATGLPERMLVGVSASTVFGFEIHRGHSDEPGRLVFTVDREGLETKIHQRVNVRVVELLHAATGSSVELEVPRVGPWHGGEVIDALQKN